MVGIDYRSDDEGDSTLETDSSLSLLDPPDDHDSDISLSDLEKVAEELQDED